MLVFGGIAAGVVVLGYLAYKKAKEEAQKLAESLATQTTAPKQILLDETPMTAPPPAAAAKAPAASGKKCPPGMVPYGSSGCVAAPDPPPKTATFAQVDALLAQYEGGWDTPMAASFNKPPGSAHEMQSLSLSKRAATSTTPNAARTVAALLASKWYVTIHEMASPKPFLVLSAYAWDVMADNDARSGATKVLAGFGSMRGLGSHSGPYARI
jgi:hypothetical protein